MTNRLKSANSACVEIESSKISTGKSVGIIGGGVAGLTAAWQLSLRGHNVTVFGEAAQIGDKLAQVIPHSGISQDLIKSELNRIEKLGVKFVTNCKVDAEKFNAICNEFDAVLLTVGGHKARYFKREGAQLLTHGIEFLKAINRGEKPHVGKNVVVIGGGKIIYPFMTKKITDEGIYSDDDRFIAADKVIVPIGEVPVLDFLPEVKKFRDWLIPLTEKKILPKVFATGDARLTTIAIDKFLRAEEISLPIKKQVVPSENLSKKFFEKCHHCDLPDPLHEHLRCVSCGTCRDCKMCLN